MLDQENISRPIPSYVQLQDAHDAYMSLVGQENYEPEDKKAAVEALLRAAGDYLALSQQLIENTVAFAREDSEYDFVSSAEGFRDQIAMQFTKDGEDLLGVHIDVNFVQDKTNSNWSGISRSLGLLHRMLGSSIFDRRLADVDSYIKTMKQSIGIGESTPFFNSRRELKSCLNALERIALEAAAEKRVEITGAFGEDIFTRHTMGSPAADLDVEVLYRAIDEGDRSRPGRLAGQMEDQYADSPLEDVERALNQAYQDKDAAMVNALKPLVEKKKLRNA
jgi:hypothetical protein